MSPENPDTRLTRLEERTGEHKDQLRALGPLVSQYAVLAEKVGNLRGEVNEAFQGIRGELAEMKKDFKEDVAEIKKDAADQLKWRRTMGLGLAIAVIGLAGNLVLQLVSLRGH